MMSRQAAEAEMLRRSQAPQPKRKATSARLVYDDGVLTVQDLASQNHTYVNGKKVHSAEVRELADGDVLGLWDSRKDTQDSKAAFFRIWFCGCEHHCKGCSNPELWGQPESSKITLQSLMKIVHSLAWKCEIDGLTLSGGDPFYQPDALSELLPELNKISRDDLIYTGYLYEDLRQRYSGLLEQIAVLIDGPYVEALNSGSALKGSSNQKIIFVREEFRHIYEDYCESWQNYVQNFTTPTGVASVGIHRPGYNQELEANLKKRGLTTWQ